MNDTQRPHVFINQREWAVARRLLEEASIRLHRRSREFETMFTLWRKLQITNSSKRFILEVENQ